MDTDDRPHLLDAKQAASLLGISERLCRQMGRDRRLPVIRIGDLMRFDQDDLFDWIDQSKERAAAAGKPAPSKPINAVREAMALLHTAHMRMKSDEEHQAQRDMRFSMMPELDKDRMIAELEAKVAKLKKRVAEVEEERDNLQDIIDGADTDCVALDDGTRDDGSDADANCDEPPAPTAIEPANIRAIGFGSIWGK